MSVAPTPHAPEDTHPLYAEVIAAIKADPEAIIRERRIEQIMSFKLMLPDLIWAAKRNRAHHYEQYETAKAEVDKRRALVELAIKEEVDPATGKPANRNKEKRDVAIDDALNRDPTWQRFDAMRRRMYAQSKQLEHEITRLEDYDRSMTEIMAMMTALIEHETRWGREVKPFSIGRTSTRATRRARAATDATIDTLTVAGS